MVSLLVWLVMSTTMGTASTVLPHQLLLGPVFERPTSLAANPAIQSVARNITDILRSAFVSGITPYGNFSGNDTALSLTAVAVEEASTFLDFHHSPASLNVSAGSTKIVTKDSVYRIGSISKLFTVYTLLLNHGIDHWNKPVTYYIPELREAIANLPPNSTAFDHVQWDEVTIGSLASQLSGIGRDYNNADLVSQDFPWEQAGLPPLPPDEIPTCAGEITQAPCDRKEFFHGFVKRDPVFLPYTTPVYSNAAYRVLAYVLEAIAKSPYTKLVTKDVFEPLGLDKSSTTPPKVKGLGVIPAGESGWGRDLGDEVSTGGLYSSSRDLAEFGRAILTNKQLPSMVTRRWMKPQAHTSALRFSVGAPWEIFRSQSGVTKGHIIDLYTKSGSDDLYESLFILVPDFDIVVSILAAGADASLAVNAAAELTVQKLLPSLEGLARTKECHKYCGKYEGDVGKVNSSLVLDVDQNGPGLVVKSWISNGIDLKATAQAFSDSTKGGKIKSIKLYPTDLRSKWSSDYDATVSYRAIFETVPPGYDPTIERIFNPTFNQWAQIDQLMYGEVAVDEFVFHLDRYGNAVAVEPRVLRETFRKVH